MKVLRKILSLFRRSGDSKKQDNGKTSKALNNSRKKGGGKFDSRRGKGKPYGVKCPSAGAKERSGKSGETPGRGGNSKGGKNPASKGNSLKRSKPKKTVLQIPPEADLISKTAEFASLGLKPCVLAAVEKQGYNSPTEIQKLAIPIILEGADVVGTAQTGTGKTAAFALPVIQKLFLDAPYEQPKPSSPRVLVLSPTRELAAQTAQAFEKFSEFTPIETLLIQGGVSMNPQIDALESGVDVVVATPGRLLDHIRQRNINLKFVRYLVLDEVDRMFDMGFIEDVSNIIRYCSAERQTLFFSATMPEAVMKLSRWALKNPKNAGVGIAHSPADTIEHYVYPVDAIQKYDLLLALLKTLDFSSTIIFTRTRRDADRIAEWIEANNACTCSVLHSDKTQRERDSALKAFKEGKVKVLVATDIASRGLDISNITYVINYNVPEQPEDYVHRIGRTGRANAEGRAITLFSSDEASFLDKIESFIGRPIERRTLDGFAYRSDPMFDARKAASTHRKRRNH